MPARDALGRPVPDGSPAAVAPVPDAVRSTAEALDLAQSLLDEDRAFFAHEVLEAKWKICPSTERDYWQGLAQLCVGVTHLQRGNVYGAITLLRRGAGHLTGRLSSWALDTADHLESGDLTLPQLRLRDSAAPRPAPGSLRTPEP